LCFCKFSRSFSPPLLFHVLHIIPMGSEEEMVWIHTGGVITAMQHMEPIWDGAMVYDPRSPMGGVR